MRFTLPSQELLEKARLDVVEKHATHLIAEIALAEHSHSDKKYWQQYLATKYQYQEATNKFYILLHEMSKC